MSQTQTTQILVLKLRKRPKKVTWHKSVINNEHMNKKKSNKCCIFHKKRPYYESSSEDEDSDCSSCK